MTTITQTLSSLGTPPQTTDTANFDPRADTLFGTSLPLLVSQTNTLVGQINTVAGEVNANAVSAAASAASALVAGTATKWVSGTTYAEGVGVWSPIDYAAYRRIVAGAGTTDPSADATNWKKLGVGTAPKAITGSTYTILPGDVYILNQYSVNTQYFTFPAAANNIGREITITNLVNMLVNSASSNILPLGDLSPTSAILSATSGKWAKLVSDGTYWVIVAAN